MKKFTILLTDLLLHLGIFSPLCLLPGYLPLLVSILYPITLFLERRWLGATLAEILWNAKFVAYPGITTHVRNIFNRPIFIPTNIIPQLRRPLRVIIPLAAFFTYLFAEPMDSFASGAFTEGVQKVAAIECFILTPFAGEIENGFINLPRNGGYLPYILYKMENRAEKMTLQVQQSMLNKDLSSYPQAIIMKAAVFVILEETHLDRVDRKEGGTHLGYRSTIIRGVKNNQRHLIHIVLVDKKIYKMEAIYPLNDSEKETLADHFIHSFQPAK